MSDKRFLPVDFPLPALEVPGKWKIKPLGRDDLERDYAAIMSSIDHLRDGGFMLDPARGIDWPSPTWSKDEAMLGLAHDELGNLGRFWMCLAVISPDDSEEYGCIYVWPSFKAGWDAMVMMWTSAARYEELDAKLWEWTKAWVTRTFPFDESSVAYPGREIPWDEWEALDDAMMPVSDILHFLEGTEASGLD